jgi:hypothetical protein
MVIVAAAFCPHPPVLVPALARGAAAELDGLRTACRTAIRRVSAPGRRLVVIGAGPDSRAHQAPARGSFAGFGVPLEVPLGSDEPGPVELPLSLTVGAWLVRDALGADNGAIGRSVVDGDVPDVGGDVALLVMGDGSARRSTAAPGYLDDRAEGFDRTVLRALRGGDAAALRALDAEVGADLLAAGVPAWHAAAALLGDVAYTAKVLYDDARYGVGYFVAVWDVASR